MKISLISVNNIFLRYNKLLYKYIKLNGWVRNFRNKKFIIFNDGSTSLSLQLVLQKKYISNLNLKFIVPGVAIKVNGQIVPSLGKEQNIEVKVFKLIIMNNNNKNNIFNKSILQAKYHSLNELRKYQHLRFNTNIFSSIMRIRHNIIYCINKFFTNYGYIYINTPILTLYDTEGNSKMFSINKYNNKNNKIFLTVSGQLSCEAAIIGLNKVYTISPVFRAENSNTTRHLSEFWMLEVEISFCKLKDIINISKRLIIYIFKYIYNKCYNDIIYINKFNINHTSNNIDNFYCNKLYNKFIINNSSFITISYSKAIKILKKENNNKIYCNIKWGENLKFEHEQFLSRYYFKKIIIIYDYPKNIKSFYMRLNKDNKTVSSFDYIFPIIGEIIGGSQREERYNMLLKQMKYKNIDCNKLNWYIQTRLLGDILHSGFGLGIERITQFITGINNIKDVIPFPITYNTINV